MIEQYIVKMMYLKTDGFYTTTTEVVSIKIKKGVREKCNHQLVEDIVKAKYKDCVVYSVGYV